MRKSPALARPVTTSLGQAMVLLGIVGMISNESVRARGRPQEVFRLLPMR